MLPLDELEKLWRWAWHTSTYKFKDQNTDPWFVFFDDFISGVAAGYERVCYCVSDGVIDQLIKRSMPIDPKLRCFANPRYFLQNLIHLRPE